MLKHLILLSLGPFILLTATLRIMFINSKPLLTNKFKNTIFFKKILLSFGVWHRLFPAVVYSPVVEADCNPPTLFS